MDQSRYEEVPKKESKIGKAFKNFGTYLKLIFKTQVESFKYNKMKLPGLMLAIGGIIIGLFLSAHAATIKQLTFTVSTFDTTTDGAYTVITKSTGLLEGMPYDYTGIVIFVLMLLGILNIFIALNVSNKQNLGSVVSATIITLVMIGLSIAYIYAVMYFKSSVDGGAIKLDLEAGYKTNFLANYMTSIVVIVIADVLSLLACVLGFIHYNRAYEKGSDR
ncbi:MAG: hypothetical protein K6B64_04695 [Acholeplasmatales bacterium]|nr:hypothetical protein [Acholeplasmatales bacterium]